MEWTPGPVESTAEYWHWDDSKQRHALVLDAAGATEKDVSAAFEALRTAYRVRSEWDYFTAVIRERIASRILARREVQ